MQLRFALPGTDHEVRCRGEIVFAQDWAMGIRIVDLAEDDRVAIEETIDSLVPAAG